MKELTEEQIEKSAEAFWSTVRKQYGQDGSSERWHQVIQEVKQEWREIARAAAPFMQIPWEMPTDDEISRATNEASYATMSFVLRRFVERRNYDRLPKVDKRVEIVAQTLRCTGLVDPLEDRYVAVAKNIIEALDKEKP